MFGSILGITAFCSFLSISYKILWSVSHSSILNSQWPQTCLPVKRKSKHYLNGISSDKKKKKKVYVHAGSMLTCKCVFGDRRRVLHFNFYTCFVISHCWVPSHTCTCFIRSKQSKAILPLTSHSTQVNDQANLMAPSSLLPSRSSLHHWWSTPLGTTSSPVIVILFSNLWALVSSDV